MPTGIGTRHPDINRYLSEEQRLLTRAASEKDVERANDLALQAAIKASRQHDDGLTAAQKFARETGNADLIEEANDEALALALQASLDPANDAPKSARTSVPDEEFLLQRAVLDKLRQVLAEQGFVIKKNNGDSNNCLIISMLQHVTDNYESNHTERARHYKALVSQWSNGQEKSSSALFSDDALGKKLVEQINRDYFNDQKDAYLRFQFFTADLDGNPAVRTLGDGPRTAAIIDGAGHYEACVRR